jgi:ACS family hexuronate transporter-like MFS transporter
MPHLSPPASAVFPPASGPPRPRISWRWLVVALLVVSTFLNYFDRQILSVLKTTLKQEFALTDTHYSLLITAFMLPYVLMYPIGGRLVDRFGPRWCMVGFVAVWSSATLGMGFAGTFAGFVALRGVLGAAEPGNYPAALRTCTVLFPPAQRGLPISLFSAGSAVGAIVAPPLIAWIAVAHGWRWAFTLPAVIGFGWVGAWLAATRRGSGQSALLTGGDTVAAAPLGPVLRSPNIWRLILARLVSDPVWYFYLFWLPGYLQEVQQLTLSQIGWVAWVPFLVADVGGIAAAHLSDRLVRRGWSADRARKTVLTAAAFVAPVGIFTTYFGVAGAIVIFSLVAIVCTTWLFNQTALLADVAPRESVASVHGISGACGALGGLIFNAGIGPIVDAFGYTPVFVVAGGLHLTAAFILRGVRSPSPGGAPTSDPRNDRAGKEGAA